MDAQLVIDRNHSKLGIAVRNAKFVCPLPEDWRAISHPMIEITLLPDGTAIVTHPDRAPLLIEPNTGAVRKL